MIADMASAENVAAGARAVFFSIAYPDPQDGFVTRDAASVFDQLDALFRASRAISDPQWLGAAAGGDGPAEVPGAEARAGAARSGASTWTGATSRSRRSCRGSSSSAAASSGSSP